MISRERLEKLIEQGSTIYNINHYPLYPSDEKIEAITLNKDYFIKSTKNGDTLFVKEKEFGGNEPILTINQFFETKEDAEEYLQYGNRTRIVKFEAPTWEKLQRMVNSTTEWNVDFCIDCSHKQDLIVSVCRTIGTIDKEQPYIIRLRHYYENDCYDFEYSREGYNKARDLCLKLFYGKG